MCPLVTDIREDLSDYVREDFFRLYTTDLSLLLAMKDFSLKQNIVENTIAGNTKGGLYECLVADMLYKAGHEIYFYKNNNTYMEIEFLIQTESGIIPIEVKAGNNRSKSLDRILKSHDFPLAYKFVDGNAEVTGRKITMPLYMAMFL